MFKLFSVFRALRSTSAGKRQKWTPVPFSQRFEQPTAQRLFPHCQSSHSRVPVTLFLPLKMSDDDFRVIKHHPLHNLYTFKLVSSSYRIMEKWLGVILLLMPSYEVSFRNIARQSPFRLSIYAQVGMHWLCQDTPGGDIWECIKGGKPSIRERLKKDTCIAIA